MRIWTNGKLFAGKKQIDSLNFTLHYANPSAWEGIRSYLQEDGTTKIFKLEAHIKRFFNTAKIMGFEIPYSEEEIVKACNDVVEGNGGGDLYLRPVAYANYDAESIRPQNKKISVDIYAFPIPNLHENAKPEGIKMGISNLVRGYPQYQMQAKTASNYAGIHLSENIIKQMMVDDIFFLDNQGYVTEATVANVLVIHGDVIFTPPNDGSILPGLTRQTLADIITFNKWDMEKKLGRSAVIVEKKVTKADLYTADAVLLCGTYAEVVNVCEIDGRKLKGSVYYEYLRQTYSNLVRGKKS